MVAAAPGAVEASQACREPVCSVLPAMGETGGWTLVRRVPANGGVVADRCPSLSGPAEAPLTIFCCEKQGLDLPGESSGTGKTCSRAAY